MRRDMLEEYSKENELSILMNEALKYWLQPSVLYTFHPEIAIHNLNKEETALQRKRSLFIFTSLYLKFLAPNYTHLSSP